MNDLANPSKWKPVVEKRDRSWLIFIGLFIIAYLVGSFAGAILVG